MPVTTWADGNVPTASQFNTNFRDQVVSTVTSGTRPSGTEGQIIYETDTDLLYIYNGGWVRFGASAGWTSYTPTLVQSSTVTKTVTYAKYEKIGRLVIVNGSLAITGTGVANNAVNVGLPFTAATANLDVGVGDLNDTSAATRYPFIVNLGSVTAMQFFDSGAGFAQAMGQTGAPFAAALASGDVINFHAMYEAST
jgi:hypothetical protein